MPETFPFSFTLKDIETVIEASIVAAACAERLIIGLAGLKSARERPFDISISTLPEPLVLVLAEVSDCTPFAALPLKVEFLIPSSALEVELEAVFDLLPVFELVLVTLEESDVAAVPAEPVKAGVLF